MKTAGTRTIPHAVSGAGSNTYAYDCNGNQITRVVGGSTFNLAYDTENHLTTVSGATSASFTYDGNSNQVKTVVGGVTTTYIGNYFEWTGSTSTMKKYYFAGSQRIAMRSGTADPVWIFFDHLNSTSKIAAANGTMSYTALYKAWGETRYTSGTAPTTYKYTGQREESSFGLYYYGARWYDTALGRFVQADTMIPNPSNPQAWDRYAYVYNNPLSYSDISGHNPSWLDFLMGFSYQFLNDLTLGTIELIAASNDVCMDCNQSDAYEQGQQAGRATSTVVASTEQVVGAASSGAVAAALGDTIAGGGACAALTGGGCAPVAVAAVVEEVVVIVEGVAVSAHGTAVIAFSNIHHIATDKHTSYWTELFNELFNKGGLSLQDKANLLELVDHNGPHAYAYHETVYNRLLKAIKGLTGKEEIAAALRAELQVIAEELLVNPGPLRGPCKVPK